MPASKEISLTSDKPLAIKKLGILAGSGELPRVLIKACEAQNISPFIVAFKGQTDEETVEGQAHLWTRLGAAGEILKTLKNHDVQDLVMIGRISRPALREIRPDLKGAKILAKIGLNSLGDDGLLQSLRKVFESEGFTIHGVQDFAAELLGGIGVLTKAKPQKGDRADIARGVEVLTHMGDLDIGQALIIQQGVVLGLEAAEGTDALIQRCEAYKRKGRGGILVKMPKPSQDRKLDLPTIGIPTIQHAVDTGLSGIAYQAGATLLVDQEQLVKIANAHNIFIIGFDPDKGMQT